MGGVSAAGCHKDGAGLRGGWPVFCPPLPPKALEVSRLTKPRTGLSRRQVNASERKAPRSVNVERKAMRRKR